MLRHELSDVVGAKNASVDPGELTAQAADWSWMSQLHQLHDLELPTADVMVRPGSAQEVAKVLRIASDHRIQWCRGGDRDPGGTFALYGGIALDLTRWTA